MKNVYILILMLCSMVLIPGLSIKSQPINIAPLATPTHSGGGVGIYGPTNYNDLINIPFTFGWVSGTGGPNMWIQYTWTTPRTFNKITFFPDQTTNRTLTAGDIQVWNGSAWVTHTSFSVAPALMFDVLFNPVTTTMVRVINMTVIGSQASNPSIREIQVFQASANSPNDAGISAIVEPTSGCEGTKQVQVEITNFGINQIHSATIFWSLNGIFQPSVNYSQTLDTANGTGPNKDTVTLGNVTFVNSVPRVIRAWTVLPNNQIDTINYNDTTEITIIGRAYPAVNLGPDVAICPGTALMLNSGPGNDSIRWSTNAITQSISVNTPGTYSVEVFKYGCEGGDTIIVSMHPAPPAVDLGPDTSICFGNSITLDATAPGVTYLWNDNSTAATKMVSSSGLFWVTIEDANGCKSYDTVAIGYIPEPTVSMTVSPGNVLCYGVPYTFTASPTTTGSIIYQWKINGLNSGSQTTSNTFTAPVVTGDSVSVDLITDVCSTVPLIIPSNKIRMTINPEPRLINGITQDTAIENTKRNYAVSPIPGHGYLWRASGGTIVSDSTTFAVQIEWGSPNLNAYVSLIDRDPTNCEYTNVLPVNVISIVGIDESEFGLGEAYPNPANDILNIPVKVNSERTISLTLHDLNGKIVREMYSGSMKGDRLFTISTSDLNEGMYIYKLSDSQGNISIKKLIISH